MRFVNPFTTKFKLLAWGVAIIALLAALAYLYHAAYSRGVGTANTRISQYENKIRELNERNLRKEIIVRERVINNYHTRQIVRTKVEYRNRDVIRTRVPEQFKLSQGWIHAHDQAAKGEGIDPEKAANPLPSNTSDNQALIVVSDNYNLANRNADQLEALQNYLRGVGLTNEETTNTQR